jgi:hypothetical protein
MFVSNLGICISTAYNLYPERLDFLSFTVEPFSQFSLFRANIGTFYDLSFALRSVFFYHIILTSTKFLTSGFSLASCLVFEKIAVLKHGFGHR